MIGDLFYIPKHSAWVNIKVDPQIRDEVLDGFKFYLNRYICNSREREFEHLGVDGDFVLCPSPGSYSLIIRENYVHADPRLESNLIEFGLAEWDVLEITINMVEGKPRLALGEKRKMQDNGVTPEQACHAFIEGQLAELADPLPEGISFWMDSNCNMRVHTLRDFYNKKDVHDAWDELTGHLFVLPQAPNQSDEEVHNLLKGMVESYLRSDFEGAVKIKQMRAVTVDSHACEETDFLIWVAPNVQRPLKPLTIPEMSFDEDDYYVWEPLISDPYGVDCQFDDSGEGAVSWVKLAAGELKVNEKPFSIYSIGQVRDIERLDILRCSRLLILSECIKDIFQKDFGNDAVWYPLSVHAIDGVVSGFWALGIVRVADCDADSEGANIMVRLDAGAAKTFRGEVAKKFYSYVGYNCKFEPLSVTKENLPDWLKQ